VIIGNSWQLLISLAELVEARSFPVNLSREREILLCFCPFDRLREQVGIYSGSSLGFADKKPTATKKALLPKQGNSALKYTLRRTNH